MPKTVNAICKKIIKVKKIIQDFWDIFQQLRILRKCCRTGHIVLQRVKETRNGGSIPDYDFDGNVT